MKKFILILLIVHCSLLIAQTPTEEWVRRFTNGNFASGYSVKLDINGNVYVLVANSQADSTNGDFCVLKYNNNGNLIWSAYYNSPGNLSDQPRAFAVSDSGDIFITGIYSINFTDHITTVKFNTDGILQWAKVYNGGGPWDDSKDIIVDNSGNIIVTGSTSLNNNTGYGLTIKYNPSGDTLWVRKLTQLPLNSSNGRAVTDDSNNIYIIGDYAGNNSDYLIFKYNTNGELQWYNTYDSPQHFGDLTWGIAIDTSRKVYVIGTNSVPSAIANNTLLKLNPNGVIQWSRTFTGIISGQGNCGTPAGVTATPDGSSIYYTTVCYNGAGSFATDITTLKYNSNGDTQWVRRYNGGVIANSNVPAAIILDRLNNIYITGYGNYQSSGDDLATIKYLPNGTQQWVASYNGPLTNSFDYGHDLAIDTGLNVYVTGISSRFNGNPILWDAVTIKYSQPIGITNNNNELPRHFKLHQNYPNPFNGSTVINYEVPVKSHIQLKIYNSLGQLVKALVNTEQPASYYTIIYNTDELSSGVYFYTIEVRQAGSLTGNFKDSKKMVLIK